MVEIDWASRAARRARRARGLTSAQPASSFAATSGETLPPESTSTVPGRGSTSPASSAATGAARRRLDRQLGAGVEEAEGLGDLLLAHD